MRRSSVFVNKCAVDPDRNSVDSLNIPERDRKSQSLDRKSSGSGLDFKRTFSLTLKKPNRDHDHTKRPLPPLPPSLSGASPSGSVCSLNVGSTPSHQCCSNNGTLGSGVQHRRTKSDRICMATVATANDRSTTLPTTKMEPTDKKIISSNSVDRSARSGSINNKENKVKYNVDGYLLPMSPKVAIKAYGHVLTDFEESEIVSYPQVWYVGQTAKKVIGKPGAPNNNGYDEDNGNYIKTLNDHLVYRYQILDVIGKGSFGQVVKAYDHKNGTMVAIKIIRNKKRFHHQALVEVKLLDLLRRKDKENKYNLVHMGEYFYFRNHLCITFELLWINLYELLKRNNFQGFSNNLIRKFAYSMLLCLRMLHREKIIHCDFKPENILLRERGRSAIKVVDFGSSCYEHQRLYTYIQSRFYRSPEVILGLPYTTAIDMWSFGCILAELQTGYPLFPGENETDQLSCIMEVLGMPPNNMIDEAKRKRIFFDSKGNYCPKLQTSKRKRRIGSKDLHAKLHTDDPQFIDFLKKCLEWDPAVRWTPDEALRHPWLKPIVPRTLQTISPNTSESLPAVTPSQIVKKKGRQAD
ncbi:dual specificity tyrosine-phosphorylation-regulated kinase 4-like isoform X2 [Bolinopsis microptera]|uniref:dual specificity tyrosine-phosphorylation-regulated kinase 4-like isoform X2 n=1 Tax=Bolinopsis microptera TaxID=2820187 RepID=UPI003079E12E